MSESSRMPPPERAATRCEWDNCGQSTVTCTLVIGGEFIPLRLCPEHVCAMASGINRFNALMHVTTSIVSDQS